MAKKKESEALKGTVTVSLNKELIGQLKASAYWLRTTISEIAEKGIEKEVKRLQRTENKGKPFDEKDVKNKTGRPQKR